MLLMHPAIIMLQKSMNDVADANRDGLQSWLPSPHPPNAASDRRSPQHDLQPSVTSASVCMGKHLPEQRVAPSL